MLSIRQKSYKYWVNRYDQLKTRDISSTPCSTSNTFYEIYEIMFAQRTLKFLLDIRTIWINCDN